MVSKPDYALENQEKITYIDPKPGSVWRHYKGDLYHIVCLSVESNEPHGIKVSYRSDQLGYIWEHPLSEWFAKVKLDDGSEVLRFTEILDEYGFMIH